MEVSPVVICAIAVVILLFAERQGDQGLRAKAKTLASCAFLAFASTNLDDSAPTRFVIVAQILSLVGDVLLLAPRGPLFLAGILAFLCAHVAYIGAFLGIGVSLPAAGLAAVLLAPAGFAAWRWLGPHTGSLKPAVLAYLLIISCMVVGACGALAQNPGPPRGLLLLAAWMFLFSDLAVARERFVAKGFTNKLWGLPLYYAAQILFAVSISWILASEGP